MVGSGLCTHRYVASTSSVRSSPPGAHGRTATGSDYLGRFCFAPEQCRLSLRAGRPATTTEGVGFEPTDPFGSFAFKASALSRSATPPDH
jgi:hypothetical protein